LNGKNKEGNMLSERKQFQKFSNSIICLAIILLVGVLTMSYGFFNNFKPALYLGLGVTIASSYFIIFHVIVLRKA
jgi:preprotein translocase subunit SecF